MTTNADLNNSQVIPLPDAAAASRFHRRAAIGVMVLFLVLFTALDLIAHSNSMARYIDSHFLARYRAVDRPYVRMGTYSNFFDLLLLQEINGVDKHDSGVYFLGSSNVVFCADFRSLTPDQQAHLHNFGFPGASVTQIVNLTKFLVDTRGLAKNNPQKFTFLIALTQDDIQDPFGDNAGAGEFLNSYVNSSPFFTYDDVNGLADRADSAWHRTISLHRARVRSFCERLADYLTPVIARKADPAVLTTEEQQITPELVAHSRQTQIDRIDELLTYLNQKKINAGIIFLPKGSWGRGGVFYNMYKSRVPNICEKHHVPFYDLSEFLRDDEFMDGHHASFKGSEKVNAELIRLSLKAMEETGR